MNSNNNPATPEIDKVSTKKITVGFKCAPNLKMKLSQSAQKLEMSLSEYVENIISNFDEPGHEDQRNKTKDESKPEPAKPKSEVTEVGHKTCFDNLEKRLTILLEEQMSPILMAIEEVKDLMISGRITEHENPTDENMQSLNEENETLKARLAEITDHKGLQELYEKYYGKTLEYQTKGGEIRKIKVSGYSEIITALVETSIDKQ